MSGKRAKEKRRVSRVNIGAHVLLPGDPIPQDADGFLVQVPVPLFKRALALSERMKRLSNGSLGGDSSSVIRSFLEVGLQQVEAMSDEQFLSTMPKVTFH